jgi:beta-glucanase (GH16 family)
MRGDPTKCGVRFISRRAFHLLFAPAAATGVLGALILAVFIFLLGPQNLMSLHLASPTEELKNDWVLTWSDEFNGPNGSAPDERKWNLVSGGSGWGNDELQYYTTRRKNVRNEEGNLVIEALKEEFVGPDGVRRGYTSARLTTAGLFSQKYGRFEARIQIPSGKGVWPAFWLMGDNLSTVGWPACGEIDVMENVGKEPTVIHGSLHGPGYSGDEPLTTAYSLPQGRLSDGFHVFAIEWEPQEIRFYVDEKLFATKTAADVPSQKPWVYDHPFFILLNLAVGGQMPGAPDNSTTFPQRMLVDYVRVYRRK